MTTIASEHRSMIEYIAENLALPVIKSLYIPPPEAAESKNGEFGVLTLEDGTVGLVYLLLSNTLQAIQSKEITARLIGRNPAEVALAFEAGDEIEKALAMGAFNVISQFVFSRSGYALDFTTNALDEIEFSECDQVGMVGFFPPLVQRLRDRAIPLTVLELKEELVTVEENFEVTLNPDRLSECNKIICTATTLINSSIDFLLGKCNPVAQIAVIGPTAGFLPDVLFEHGVDLVGGSQIPDSVAFIENCKKDQKWGLTAQKYCLTKKSYPGYKALVERAAR
jgi:uncharacterized protein (DUF4213/DUF364 family)